MQDFKELMEFNVEETQSKAHLLQEVSLTGPTHPEVSPSPFSYLFVLLLCFQQDHRFHEPGFDVRRSRF